jgi:hypothetical protein
MADATLSTPAAPHIELRPATSSVLKPPAWATHKEENDKGTPDAWTEYTADLGSLPVVNGDTYTHDDLVTLTARATTAGWPDSGPSEPIIEVSDASYNNVVFGLTPVDARTLAGMLTDGADRLQAKTTATVPLLPMPTVDGPVRAHGRCAWFCAPSLELERPHVGLDVEEHGPACTATAGHIDGRTAGGQRMNVCVELARPYLHGTYPAGTDCDRDNLVMLAPSLTGDAGTDLEPVYLTVGEARRMIALLQYAVDNLDQVNTPLPSLIRREYGTD